MTERPILFSASMVRAVLAGTKTQTRRVVKPQPENDPAKHHPIVPYNNGRGGWNWVLEATGHGTGDPFPCPYGKPGDRLWVREAWGLDQADNGGDRHWCRFVYRADPGAQALDNGTPVPWKPSIHMPRRASRITLEVTGVRVERLQAISASDAISEGIPRGGPENPDGIEQREYRALWESINGQGSWDANPWVWVVEFRGVS